MLAARACGRLAASRAVAVSAVHRVAVAQHLGAATTMAPVRWHGSHGHSHGSARLPASSGPEQQRAARTVVSVGLLSDFMLTGVKGAAGWLTGSSALVSDAIHSAADMVVSMMAMVRALHAMRACMRAHGPAWQRTQSSHEVALTAMRRRGLCRLQVTTKYASEPPDHGHPFGHGRLDSLGALGISILLTGAGASIGWRALQETAQVLQGLTPAPLLQSMEGVPDLLSLGPNTAAAVAIGACLTSVGASLAHCGGSVRLLLLVWRASASSTGAAARSSCVRRRQGVDLPVDDARRHGAAQPDARR